MTWVNGSYALNHHSLVGSGGSTHTGHVSDFWGEQDPADCTVCVGTEVL